MTMTVYNLARGGSPQWQHAIDYAPHYPDHPFYFSAGNARESHGAYLSAKEALEFQWQGDLEKAGALWLVPLFERIVRGDAIALADVLEAYRIVHGHEPSSEEWPVRLE